MNAPAALTPQREPTAGHLTSHRRRQLALASLAVLALALAWPANANAILGFDPGGIARDVFGSILRFLLGDLDEVGRQLVEGLVGLPLFASGNPKYEALMEYQRYTTWLVYPLVALMFTIGALRYWATAIGQGSPYEALRIMGRSGIALAGVLAWVPGFDLLTRAFNELSAALLNAPGVGDGLTNTLVDGLSLAPLNAGGLGMLALVCALFAAFALIVVKVVITALLAILFVLGPIAIAFWPLEDTAWLARSCLQSIFVLMLWPALWAVCFAVFALLGSNTFNSFGLGDTSALVALAALVTAWKLPTIVARQALMGGLVPNVAPMRLMAGAYGARQLMRARGGGSGQAAAAGARG